MLARVKNLQAKYVILFLKKVKPTQVLLFVEPHFFRVLSLHFDFFYHYRIDKALGKRFENGGRCRFALLTVSITSIQSWPKLSPVAMRQKLTSLQRILASQWILM